MSGLLKSTGIVSVMTFLSRVLGFVRDILFAAFFGATAGMDAFLIAFQIPNFMRRLFAEGAFSQAFVPVLAQTRAEEEERTGKAGDTDVRELISVVMGTLTGILSVLVLLGVLAAPAVVALFAPGFLNDPTLFRYDTATELLKITFPYLLLISLTAMAAGVLNTYGRFAIPAVTPVWLNICFIVAILCFEPTVYGLAWAVFVAGIVQFAFQLPFLRNLGLLPMPRWGWRHPKVRRIVKLMLPILFGSSVTQISLLIGTILASILITGSVTWLYLSDRLMEFPLGIFTIAIATVILPTLSDRFARKDKKAFSDTLDWALRLLLLLGTPAMVGLFVLAGPLVVTIFYYGEMTPRDVDMIRWALMAYSLGFMGFSLVKILVPGFFSRQDTRTPVICGLIAVGATIAMNLGFVFVLLHIEAEAPHVGLALATSLGAFVNAGLLYWNLRKADVYHPASGWSKTLLIVVIANSVMAVFLFAVHGDLADWLAYDIPSRALHLSGLVFGGALVYLSTLAILGVRPRHLVLPAVPKMSPVTEDGKDD